MGRPLSKVFIMAFKDLSYALIGLAVSIILAVSINDDVRRELLQFIGY